MEVRINDTSLKNIADKIREKNKETSSYKPSEMPDAIDRIQVTEINIQPKEIVTNGTYEVEEGIDGYNPITVNVPPNVTSLNITRNGTYTATDVDGYNEIYVEVDGVPTDEELTFKGDCTGLFKGSGWNWFFDKYEDRLSSRDITDAEEMFYSLKGRNEPPFTINLSKTQAASIYYIIYASEFHRVKITGLADAPRMSCMYCSYLREADFDEVDWSYVNNSYCNQGRLFAECYSLRKLPSNLPVGSSSISYSQNLYYQLCYHCYVLDEVKNLPVNTVASISRNMFEQTFEQCFRLKDFTFETNEDGTPKVAQWKGQTINLVSQVGYLINPAAYRSDVTSRYNSGITLDKEVTDDATYQALKNDPDWFASNMAYSRYNYESAVRTINSLPDTSAYGTNTIKFVNEAGSLTDGGSFSTHTEEEIAELTAIAAAKGWTITLA